MTDKEEWFTKMEGYRAAGDRSAEQVERRVRGVAWGPSVWDWDDNIPEAWGVEMAEKWGLASTDATQIDMFREHEERRKRYEAK